MVSVSLPGFAKLRSQAIDVFIINPDFDLRQHFFLLSENCGMWSNISFSMSAVMKKALYNFIGQLLNLLNEHTMGK